MNTPYYHSTTRNLIAAFGDIFNKLTLVRYDQNKKATKQIVVPIEYGPKQKWYRAITGKDDKNKNIALYTPRMGYEVDIEPDYSRKTQLLTRLFNVSSGVYKSALNPTPVNYRFSLYIITENSDDSFQLIEQILPVFNPTYNISVNLVPELNYILDIPLTLKNITKEEEYTGDFDRVKYVTRTLDFEMKTYLFGPISEADVIRHTQVDIHAVPGLGEVTPEDQATTPRHVRITTDPDPIDAEPEDDYGYTIEITEFNDNKKYNPVTDEDEEIE